MCRASIFQEVGGLQDVLTYTVFSPAQDRVFVAIDQFNFPADVTMAEEVNDLISKHYATPMRTLAARQRAVPET